MKKRSQPISELKRRLREIAHLSNILHLLSWDQEVYMPPKGGETRAASIAELTGIVHDKFLAVDRDGLLTKLSRASRAGEIGAAAAVMVKETWRAYEREKKLPAKFVRDLAGLTARAQEVWAEARAENNFGKFLPSLTKLVKFKRQEAQYVGYRESPYDALLDSYEPTMTTAEASIILNDLKDFLVPFVAKFNGQANLKSPTGVFPLDRQREFNKFLAQSIGYSFEAGRLDDSVHPFTTGAHPHDIRITTRYKENDVLDAIGSTIHEAGHGMYDQGLPVEHFGTPLGESVSLGIHESQSRLWENMIGKSLPFWKFFYPKLKTEFPKSFEKIDLPTFYRLINQVEPSLIRVEADEVTYNLHIIIRFEIEKELIEGSIAPKDLPQVWRSKVKSYLGLSVPNDRLGVLQDVHWSNGLFGYFPTYAFGNLYAAQFWKVMKKQIPDWEKQIAKGQFSEINEWLKQNIYRHGKRYRAEELCRRLTGEPLNSRYFKEYLEEKYGAIYQLKNMYN